MFLEYVLDEQKQTPEQGWQIVQNMDCVPSDKQRLEQAFTENAKLKPKRKNGVTLFHELISASPESGATPEMMYDLAQHYLQLRNTDNGMAVAALHQDKDHLHVHIMLSANARGSEKSTSISRKQFYQIREDFERYQVEKYPQIQDIVYLPEYKKEKTVTRSFASDGEQNLKKRGHGTDKAKLQVLLTQAFEKASDKSHFFSLLESNPEVQIYHRRGTPTGLLFHNRKFRFTRLMEKQELEQKFAILDRLEELSRLQAAQEHGRDDLER